MARRTFRSSVSESHRPSVLASGFIEKRGGRRASHGDGKFMKATRPFERTASVGRRHAVSSTERSAAEMAQSFLPATDAVVAEYVQRASRRSRL